MKFTKYLEFTRQQIKVIAPASAISKSPEFALHVVLGNESCDPDSMVSALTLAFHYSTSEKYKNHLVVPMINKTRELFPIRVENIYLLDKYNIPVDSLIFRDTISLEYLQRFCKLTVTLVDHHVLCQEYTFLKASVTEIFDHRPEDPTEVWGENVSKDIQVVGSCCTLIAGKILEQESVSSLVLELLYDVISYDTIAYRKEAGKVHALDYQVAELLEKALQLKINDPEQRTQRFDLLHNAYKDINKLTSEQLLYKDLKALGHICIPGLPMLVTCYLQRSDALQALEKFKMDNNAELLIIMGLEVEEDKVARDIALYGNNKEEIRRIEQVLQSRFEVEEQACETCEKSEIITCFRQKNPTLGRKQLMPLLKIEHIVD